MLSRWNEPLLLDQQSFDNADTGREVGGLNAFGGHACRCAVCRPADCDEAAPRFRDDCVPETGPYWLRPLLFRSRLASSLWKGFGAAHAVAVEVEAVGVVNKPVEDGVGIGRAADDLVPRRDR
jgi:hypothetical protein